jgi:hypothetical protein
MNPPRKTFVFTLEDAAPRDMPGDTDARLKRLLKTALRSFGFRCVALRPGENQPASEPKDPFA